MQLFKTVITSLQELIVQLGRSTFSAHVQLSDADAKRPRAVLNVLFFC